MKQIPLGRTGVQVPAVAVGCMRIASMDTDALALHIRTCVDNGMNFFDHADIYGRGACETHFAEAMRRTGLRREDVVLQSKCGICPGVMYDFSREHILEAADGILRRLGTDHLDVLVLHRPDALAEPEEVAEAFDRLESAGKVLRFGVSNHRPGQIELLRTCVRQPIVVNQLQFSIPFAGLVTAGMEANMETDDAADRSGDALTYCRLHGITVQAWSPFQHGFFGGSFVGDTEKFPELNRVLDELAQKYGVTPTAIAAAWVLRHPARIQLVAGTTSTARMLEIARGAGITLERSEWYRLYLSAGHILP